MTISTIICQPLSEENDINGQHSRPEHEVGRPELEDDGSDLGKQFFGPEVETANFSRRFCVSMACVNFELAKRRWLAWQPYDPLMNCVAADGPPPPPDPGGRQETNVHMRQCRDVSYQQTIIYNIKGQSAYRETSWFCIRPMHGCEGKKTFTCKKLMSCFNYCRASTAG